MNSSFEANSPECSWIEDSFWRWRRSSHEVFSDCLLYIFHFSLCCRKFWIPSILLQFYYFLIFLFWSEVLSMCCFGPISSLGSSYKKTQTVSVTFCEINIAALPTGKLWRAGLFFFFHSCREWRNIKNVGEYCIYHVIYWSLTATSKVNSFIGRKQKGFFFGIDEQ